MSWLDNFYDYEIVPGHPRANNRGAVNSHILICERMLGRYLKQGETVHHRDGNKKNNDESNLMVFASQSDHACYHARGCDDSLLYLSKDGVYKCRKKNYFCKVCGVKITSHATWCKQCAEKYSRMRVCKVERPSKEDLFNILKRNNGNFTAVARLYGISDNAVRKWCRKYEIPSHSKDYK